ncbi:hypothetical protein B296_00038533 [Ensete ventricosum]|uniref:Uncharacterized protein n=1 Tax=Ensete ventricosum TaxID=4639 RepID=A0A426X223_ENSVE|nr:hypothetical protein B296_00038533 [Ensete ventricosum]
MATHDQGLRRGGYTRPGPPAGAPSGTTPVRKGGTYSTRPPTGATTPATKGAASGTQHRQLRDGDGRWMRTEGER